MGVRVLVLSVAFVFVMSLAQEGLAQEAAPTPVADDPATKTEWGFLGATYSTV